MTQFERCVSFTLAEEGDEYTDDPRDPGGPTRWGITLADLRRWREGHAHPDEPVTVTAGDVRDMGQQEAREIYRAKYWNVVQGDYLSYGLDLCVFDYGVNSGTVRSVKLLQSFLRTNVDGVLGPKTLAAVRGVNDLPGLIGRFQDARQAFLESLSTFDHFGRGWTARVARIRVAALAMATRG
jgi:lysozyme family protein